MFEVIGSKVALNDWPEVDVQYTRITVPASAFRPLEIRSAAPYGDIIFDLRPGTCQTTCQHALETISMSSTSIS
jgi:hypothetical protein